MDGSLSLVRWSHRVGSWTLRRLHTFTIGFDWPLHRDWLAYVALLISTNFTTFGIARHGMSVLGYLPGAFVGVGLVLGTIRGAVRGWRDPYGRTDPPRVQVSRGTAVTVQSSRVASGQDVT